jgi:hypothetical protein
MDVGAIRAELAAALTAAGYVAYSYVPDAVEWPAAIVNPPTLTDYAASLTMAKLTIPVTIATLVTTMQDAQRILDLALSTGNPESVNDALESHVTTAWKAVNVVEAQGLRQVQDGSNTALAFDIVLECYAGR